MRNRFLFVLFFEVLFQTRNLVALQTYPLVDQGQTTLQVSRNQPNRIAVAGDRIQQIFGAEEVFDVQSDDEGGQIFVRLLDANQSDALTLTLITESGLTHDLTLMPANLPFQSILLKPGSDEKTSQSACRVQAYQAQTCRPKLSRTPQNPSIRALQRGSLGGSILYGRKYRRSNTSSI